jgi:hypothetical protein
VVCERKKLNTGKVARCPPMARANAPSIRLNTYVPNTHVPHTHRWYSISNSLSIAEESQRSDQITISDSMLQLDHYPFRYTASTLFPSVIGGMFWSFRFIVGLVMMMMYLHHSFGSRLPHWSFLSVCVRVVSNCASAFGAQEMF